MARLVCVPLDGLGFEAAKFLSFVEKLDAPARLGKTAVEMPGLSKPAYATLFSGIVPAEHGITGNSITLPAPTGNIFDNIREAGLISCAAAYYWFYELFS